MVDTNMTLDVKEFTIKALKGMLQDIDFTYPMGRFNENSAHTTFVKLQGKVGMLIGMLEMIEQPKRQTEIPFEPRIE